MNVSHIKRIPIGYSEGYLNGQKYSITKNIFNKGRSCKIFAKELQGKDMISLNFYQTRERNILRPCEMPEEKVIQFLKNVIIKSNK